MSPYTHFGQIAPQRTALYVKRHGKSHSKGVSNFIEEHVVRRELSDNFCFYNPNYDSIEGAAGWAQETLKVHATDKREYVYTEAELEAGGTHDLLWNAAQIQMVKEGKMHGFLRMQGLLSKMMPLDPPHVRLVLLASCQLTCNQVGCISGAPSLTVATINPVQTLQGIGQRRFWNGRRVRLRHCRSHCS
jgi:hypothetical protein